MDRYYPAFWCDVNMVMVTQVAWYLWIGWKTFLDFCQLKDWEETVAMVCLFSSKEYMISSELY